MADDKKPNLNLDDWDSIPLDPGADDWDDPPTSTAPSPAPSPPVETEQAAPESDIVIDFDIHEIPDSFSEPDETAYAAGGRDVPADENQTGDSDGPQAPSPDADDSDGVEASAFPADTHLDFDSILSDFGAPGAPADDTFGPSAPAADKSQVFDPFEQIDTKVPPSEPDPAPDPATDLTAPPSPEMTEANLNFEELTTKKVELDIDGIFLESGEEETPAAEEVEPEPEPPALEAPPEELPPPEPVKKKIPKAKLLIIVVPAALVSLLLVFGVYKFFFSSKGETPVAREAVIDPRVPPRDPVPGEMPLEAFYIAFPSGQGDTLVEMTMVLHYNDAPDQAIIGERLATVRDLIFRAAQGKGSQVISDGAVQKNLREELAANINLALGREAVSYVQITQIRILH